MKIYLSGTTGSLTREYMWKMPRRLQTYYYIHIKGFLEDVVFEKIKESKDNERKSK